jgi:DNA-binding transcriptional LysR family regulator
MRRRLPPLEQIEAFIEAARARTFREAANRCALSPAAFSRRIQGFSDFIGLKLFERRPGGVRLTEAGRACLAELEPAYMELRRAAAQVAGGSAAPVDGTDRHPDRGEPGLDLRLPAGAV